MTRSIRIRALQIGDLIRVKSIINHPMENGLRRIKKTGKIIPAHYITEVFVSRNDTVVLEAFWGASVARNPYLAFDVSGKKGDKISISWVDNQGQSDSASTRVV